MPTHSASALVDAVVSTFTSASEFSDQEVTASDYNVLTTAPGACAIVVRWGRTTGVPRTYGQPRPKTSVVRIDVEGFVRDTGDTVQVLTDLTRLGDDIFNVLHHDPTLGDVARIANLDDLTPQPITAEIGGFRWQPLVGRLTAEQF